MTWLPARALRCGDGAASALGGRVEGTGGRDEENRMLGVFRDYLGTEDRSTGDTNPKFTLNAHNDFTFHKIVVQGKQLGSSDRQTLNYSNRLIATAYDRLRKQFENWLKLE